MYITNELFFGPVDEKKEFKNKEVRSCLWDGWQKEQAKLPSWLRSHGALICCPCPKCTGRIIC